MLLRNVGRKSIIVGRRIVAHAARLSRIHQHQKCQTTKFDPSSSMVRSSSSSSSSSSLADILDLVRNGTMNPQDAENWIMESINKNNNNNKSSPSLSSSSSSPSSPEEALQYFANLDHTRSFRTGFPEVVFAETKTPKQVAMIMDDMARHINQSIITTTTTTTTTKRKDDDTTTIDDVNAAILATRVSPEMNNEIAKMSFDHGTVTYNEQARILSMKASALLEDDDDDDDDSSTSTQQPATKRKIKSYRYAERCVVATAGTTDLPVAEEAAIVLEAAGCEVDRIYDVGVAGLHRVVGALPRLRDEKVGAVIVCAGMDGALPSVVGGLVSVPVFAVPTSVGYGVSLGGVAAMLTMLNSCAPGVSVLNVDNGFGAATCAFKVLKKSKL